MSITVKSPFDECSQETFKMFKCQIYHAQDCEVVDIVFGVFGEQHRQIRDGDGHQGQGQDDLGHVEEVERNIPAFASPESPYFDGG